MAAASAYVHLDVEELVELLDVLHVPAIMTVTLRQKLWPYRHLMAWTDYDVKSFWQDVELVIGERYEQGEAGAILRWLQYTVEVEVSLVAGRVYYHWLGITGGEW